MQITKTYRNKRTAVSVIMDGECLGVHAKGKTCVRHTTDGRFAVIAARGDRLIAVLADELHARRYNFAIHGDAL